MAEDMRVRYDGYEECNVDEEIKRFDLGDTSSLPR